MLAPVCWWLALVAVLALAEEPALAAERAQGSAPTAVHGPELDGKLSDPLWQKGTLLTLHRTADNGPNLATTARLLRDGQYLYIGFECEEPDDAIKADEKKRDGGVYGDDCVEIFISATPKTAYQHFAVNSLGTVMDEDCPIAESVVAGHRHPPKANRGWNADVKTAAGGEPGKNWKVAVAISLKDLGAQAGADQIWSLNLTRSRKETSEEYSWAKLSGNFHHPELFGELRGMDIKPVGDLPKTETTPR